VAGEPSSPCRNLTADPSCGSLHPVLVANFNVRRRRGSMTASGEWKDGEALSCGATSGARPPRMWPRAHRGHAWSSPAAQQRSLRNPRRREAHVVEVEVDEIGPSFGTPRQGNKASRSGGERRLRQRITSGVGAGSCAGAGAGAGEASGAPADDRGAAPGVGLLRRRDDEPPLIRTQSTGNG